MQMAARREAEVVVMAVFLSNRSGAVADPVPGGPSRTVRAARDRRGGGVGASADSGPRGRPCAGRLSVGSLETLAHGLHVGAAGGATRDGGGAPLGCGPARSGAG